MAYLPIFLDARGRRTLVVGGGDVAARKVTSLLEAGATVTVVSPKLSAELTRRVVDGEIGHISRPYQSGDMNGCVLVYAATDDSGLHRRLYEEARLGGVLLNVADEPELCSFIAPAVFRRGELQVAISTGGASPALARELKERLGGQFGAEYEVLLEVLRAARVWLQAHEADPVARGQKLNGLVASKLLDCLRRGAADCAAKLIQKHLGAEAKLSAMGLSAQQLARCAQAAEHRN